MKKAIDRNEIVAMGRICNIQTMQIVITGKQWAYKQFQSMTEDELWDMQNAMIPEYNKAILSKKTIWDEQPEQVL